MRYLFIILFLFSFVESFCQALPKCIPPVVSIGANQSITLPTTSTIVTGTATGKNGHPTITDYLWALDSGISSAMVVSPLQTATQITGLNTVGVYRFSLRAKDSCGATSISYLYVTVLPQLTVIYTLKLVPNPAHHNFTATVSGNGAGKVTLRVYSPTSNLLQSASGTKSLSGAYSKLFYTYFYRPGNYTITANINGTNISQTLIIQ